MNTTGGKDGARGTCVEVVRTEAGLDALCPEWEALFERSALSAFQSFEWQRAWWRHFGRAIPGAELHVLVVRRGGAAVGIAPLHLEPASALGVVRSRRLVFLARELSDYLDVLADECERAVVLDHLAEHLVEERQGYDVALFEDVPERSPTLPVLQAALGRRGIFTEPFANERCPRVRLLDTWEKTLASFGPEHRKEIQRRARVLARDHRVDLEVCDDPATIGAALDEFVDMHQRRWAGVGRSGALATGALQSFHREVAGALARRGIALVAFLRVDGQRRASVYGFRHRGELAIYLTGRRETEDLRRLSLGMVLPARCMEWAVGQGMGVFDLLRGSHPYKYRLGALDVRNWTLVSYGAHPARAERAHRAVLLERSLRRRAGREFSQWRHVASEHGAISRASMRHLASRARRILADGVAKWRAPGLPLPVETA